MKLIMRTTLLVLFSSVFLCAFSETPLSRIESFIINEQYSQALTLLGKQKPDGYTTILQRICNKKASYTDYYTFLKNVEISSKSDFLKLDNFLNKVITVPSTNHLNLDYVKIRWTQISNSRNELSLEISNKENEQLREYVNQFKSSTNRDYQKAKLLVNSHEIVISLIQGNTSEGMQKSIIDQRIATQFRDTFLILMTKFYYSNFLVETNQLDEYIKITQESIDLEAEKPDKSEFYASNIGNLVDALIYKGNFDIEYIEDLLFSLYKTEKTRYLSYSLYAKYLGAIPENTEAQKRIFKLFNVENLEQFCDKVVNLSESKVNTLEFYHIVNECSNALSKNGYFERAIEYKDNCIQLNTQIYSKELSQSLADFQTKEAEHEKQIEIENANQRSKYYLSTTVISILFLLFLVLLLLKIRVKSKDLEIRNKERDILLREVHHRVKNNFQLIIGFLRLQEKFSRNIKIEDFIQEIEMKMNSMSLVHDLLNKETDLEKVDLKGYLGELGISIINSLTQYDFDIDFQVNGDRVEATIDQVIPIGLVANEVITNAIKHSNKQELQITICVLKDSNDIRVSIADNGFGLPENFDLEQSNSFGMKVIVLLMKQIDAKVSWENRNGLKWTFNIPKK